MPQPKGIKTQKSGLYFPTAADEVSKLLAITDWNGLGGQKGEIDATNMDSDAKEFFTGLEDSGTFSLNINFDPREISQQDLWALKDSGDVVPWYLGLSDGVTAPTLVDDVMTAPAARTGFVFDASVQQLTLSAASDNIVKGAITLRISGRVVPTWKA